MYSSSPYVVSKTDKALPPCVVDFVWLHGRHYPIPKGNGFTGSKGCDFNGVIPSGVTRGAQRHEVPC
ncbi:hypothetical protein LMG28690_05012 [Paraburkholderia caffeinilytica]|nr:hypothetical protein LMG28690_05012 [Paraburkholderia caffeinilytica]